MSESDDRRRVEALIDKVWDDTVKKLPGELGANLGPESSRAADWERKIRQTWTRRKPSLATRGLRLVDSSDRQEEVGGGGGWVRAHNALSGWTRDKGGYQFAMRVQLIEQVALATPSGGATGLLDGITKQQDWSRLMTRYGLTVESVRIGESGEEAVILSPGLTNRIIVEVSSGEGDWNL